MKSTNSRRLAIVAGAVLGAMGVATLIPSVAMAAVPNPLPTGLTQATISAGNLTLTPSSGDGTTTPAFHAANACPSGTNGANINALDGSGAEQSASPLVSGAASQLANWGGTLSDMGTIQAAVGSSGVDSIILVADCRTGAGHGTFGDAVQIDFDINGNWTVHVPTQATTTTVSANPTSAAPGTAVTLTANVAPTAAPGTVTFTDGATTIAAAVGAVSGTPGTFTTSWNTTGATVGAHTITATFNAGTGYSTSAGTTTVTITGSNTQTETINVTVPSSQGVFTMTVDSTPVQMGTAALSSDSQFFTASGQLGHVTVSDLRLQSQPGWSIAGQVANFTDGTHSFDGNSLGWTPSIVTPNAANDVTAGPAVAAQANPGLKQGSNLAAATATHGLQTSVLGAALALKFPASQPAGAYHATLTITATP